MAAAARQRLDVVVVGAGVMGSAAAHALVSSIGSAASGRQCTVALLEQHEFGHKHGSSHGHSRIIRPVYSQEHYASLMPEAYQRWGALDAESESTLYTRTGGLYWGPAGFVDPSGDSLHTHRATCDALGVEYEMLSAVDVAERWPPLDTPGSATWEGLFSPDCGILHADACVAALQAAATAGGAELHERCAVTEIEGGGEGEPVSVWTADGRRFVADACIVCAGPWAGELLRRATGLNVALQPTQNTVAYWPAEAGHEAAFEADNFPVLISDCELGAFYSIPSASEDEKGTWKFDRHGGPALAADELSDKDPARGAAEVAESATWIDRHVRWVGTEPVSVEPCVYTMTRDEDFIIDQIPTRPKIAVVSTPCPCLLLASRSALSPCMCRAQGAGFSGHGFKLAPVVGRILAQLALGGQAAVDAETRAHLHHWAITRPAVAELATAADFPYVTQQREGPVEGGRQKL